MQENVEQSPNFVVLLYLLKPLEPSRCPTSEEVSILKHQKLSNLVVKCLFKLSKVSIAQLIPNVIYKSETARAS